MRKTPLTTLLSRGADLYASLERETINFRIEILWADADHILSFERRRQELLTAIQNFDIELNEIISDGKSFGHEEESRVEDFNVMRKYVVHQVQEIDVEINARAVVIMQKIAGHLAALKSGKAALRGYAGDSGRERLTLNRQA
jgi:hypothetical protein